MLQGGRHIDYVSDMIVKQVIEQTNKKNKGGMQVKPFQVRQHMWLFVNCLIVNPTFDSQTKENMTLQIKNFGSKCTLSEKFMSNVAKSGLVEHVISWAKFKAQAILEKASGGKKVNKLKGPFGFQINNLTIYNIPTEIKLIFCYYRCPEIGGCEWCRN